MRIVLLIGLIKLPHWSLITAHRLTAHRPQLTAHCSLPYGNSPPVKIRAKFSTGKNVMIFWKVFSLLPGTIT